MKKIIPFLFLAFCLSGCAQQMQPKPENPYRLKTKVYSRYYEDDLPEIRFTYFYDEDGQVSRIEQNDGSCSFYSYDEYGNTIQTDFQNPDGTVDTRIMELTLDEQHRTICSKAYSDDKLTAITVYGYDVYGNVNQLEIRRILDTGNLDSYVGREYNAQGDLLREETIWSSGGNYYTKYEYSKGHLCYFASYDYQDVLLDYTQVTWEEATRTETRIRYNANNEAGDVTVQTYDEYGNCLKTENFFGPDTPICGGDETVDQLVLYTYEPIP